MNLARNSSLSILWTLRYLEWIFLAVHFLMEASDGDLSITSEQFWKMLAFYSAFAGLSWIFPANRRRWQQQGYIFLGVLLVVWANLTGISLDLLVYLYLAKSCFLLGGKSLLLTVAIAGIAWVSSEYISELVEIDRALTFEPPYGFRPLTSRTILVYSLGIYLASSIFVILLSSVVKAERKSRQRAEALAQQVETLAATLERTRIARDIHDSLGHTLTNLDIQLEVAQKLRQRDPNQAFQAIDTAKTLSSQCIEDVSRSLHTMRQTDFDLDQALSMLFERVQQDLSLRVECEIELPKLSLQTNHQIYNIVKEGLINIKKHARASRICFRGYATPVEIILELEDDGIGFDPQTFSSGYGLKGMAERVQLLGGKLKVDSALGQGTQIQVILPR